MILVFKTSVNTNSALNYLSKLLNGNEQVLRWNFDLEDCDNILRIESDEMIADLITQLLKNLGYECEELTD